MAMRAFGFLVPAFAATVSLFAASAAVGQGAAPVDQQVDIELVLAVDVSASMDAREQILQRRGYIAALRDPEVIKAITSGAEGRIALTYVEWAGDYHKVVVPWRVIGNQEDALAFADELALQPMSEHELTSISGGLAFAADQFDGSPATGLRRKIDVSGDGANNVGPPVTQTRDALVAQGITINGLPIVVRPSLVGWPPGGFDLRYYYEDCVIGGPGAFMVTVEDAEGFDVAIRHKLFLEIAGLAPTVILAAESVPVRPKADCLVGEHWFSGTH